MRRRSFMTLLGGAAAAWPLAARAQQPGKLPTIGFLGSTTASIASQWVVVFVQRLCELGWIEGHAVAIEYRWAESRKERAEGLAAEFVQLKVDLIMTYGTQCALAAKQATNSVPIVFGIAGRPRCQWPCCQSGATGLEHHLGIEPRDRSCHQTSPNPARDCTRPAPIVDHGEC